MIIITNKGNLDLNGLRLMGASSKRDEKNKIGFFGSGAKYAISWLMRNEVFFQLWVDGELVEVSTKEVEMRGDKYKEILINGQGCSITTDIGPKWEAWMAIREIYSNAIDEGGEMAITDEYSSFIEKGRTTFIIDEHEKLQDVIKNQSLYFARNREVVYENDVLKVYNEHPRGGGLYLKGILVLDPGSYKSGYGYELKVNPYLINEERVIISRSGALSQTLGAIMTIDDQDVIASIASMASTCDDVSNTIEFDIFSEYPEAQSICVGLDSNKVETRENQKSYVSTFSKPKNPSSEWMEYRTYPYTKGVTYKGVPFTILTHVRTAEFLGLRTIDDEKWKKTNDQDCLNKAKEAYLALNELVPEIPLSSTLGSFPFRIGDSRDGNSVIERWKSQDWISRMFLMTSSKNEIIVKMFTYLMIESGAHGEKIAAMLILERMKKQLEGKQ